MPCGRSFDRWNARRSRARSELPGLSAKIPVQLIARVPRALVPLLHNCHQKFIRRGYCARKLPARRPLVITAGSPILRIILSGSGTVAAALAAILSNGAVSAATFDITTSSTTAQTLGPTAGQTGTVEAGASLTVSGSTVAVAISGNNETFTNLGTLRQTGTGRAIRDNTGVSNLLVTNGSATNSAALMQSADADVIQMNVAGSSVVFGNYGTLTSLNASKGGAQAVDFNAMTGSNTLNNYAGGIIQARDADAVRPGLNGVVNNYGTIKSTVTTDTGSDGIDAQNNTGVVINNFANASITGARHGITGGALNTTVSFTTTVTNNSGATITGNNGSGINLDGFNARQTATIVNAGTITGNGVTGDGDGIDVDGVVNINNSGIIKSLNSFSATTPAQSEGVTVGGGIIVNSGTIEGDVAAGNGNAVGRGITLAGVDTSGTPEPIYANSVVTNLNGGLIKGQSDSAIAVQGAASGFTVTVNNNAGAVLMGGGTTNAAVRTGADNDTINNAGKIDGSSSGKAVDMGAGNNTLNVVGPTASILGNINGGIGGTNKMSVDPGAGNAFSYGGSISNFNSVEVKSGTVTLTGVNTYSGLTVLSGGVLVLDGTNRLSSASVLTLVGGTLQLSHPGGANGQTFAGLTLSGDSGIDLDFSSLTFLSLGTITGGKTLSVVDWSGTASPSYALRFLGDETQDANFLSLMSQTTIDGLAATFHFDGTYTDVAPVPLPPAIGLLLSGLLAGGIGFGRKRGVATA